MSRYRDNYAQFDANQAKVFGVSVDSTWANLAFREQMKLDFPLLSDSKKDYTRQLGILDENGILRHIDAAAAAMDPSSAIGACALIKKKK